jgi:MFS family permease
MILSPSDNLTEEQVDSGLKYVVKDGLLAEAMAVLTGGAFLTAMAVRFGATNFQIGLLAAIPTLANLFQLLSVYLVQKYQNRRAITVFSSIIARLSLFLVSFLPFIFPPAIALIILILLLLFHHTLGSISGTSWNSWMKDLIPEKRLGSFFSRRSRLIQTLSITLCFSVGFLLDYVRKHHPDQEINMFSVMFFVGGAFGLIGVYMLIRTPEPKVQIEQKNFFKLFQTPFQNTNFRNLMIFHACWSFAINLAAPFFTVYMLKMLNFPISSIIAFAQLSQISNIFFIKLWGKYSDKYSNKSILQICAPIYLCCILAWTFTTMPQKHEFTVPLLILIHIFSGMSVSGINLALGNIGLKLAPKGNAIIYISARSLLIAFVAGMAPLAGGLFADFFAARQLSWNLNWKGPNGELTFHTLDLQAWDFFFVLAVIFGLFALYRLTFVKEEGEVQEKLLRNEIMDELVRGFKSYSTIAGLRSIVTLPASLFMSNREKLRPQPEGKG